MSFKRYMLVHEGDGSFLVSDPNGDLMDAKQVTTAISQRDAEIAQLRAELDAAKAVIEKLPKTADGVVIAPGDKIYIRSRYENGVECMIAYIEAANLRMQVAGAFSGCYSTRKAALAAKENPNAKA